MIDSQNTRHPARGTGEKDGRRAMNALQQPNLNSSLLAHPIPSSHGDAEYGWEASKLWRKSEDKCKSTQGRTMYERKEKYLPGTRQAKTRKICMYHFVPACSQS